MGRAAIKAGPAGEQICPRYEDDLFGWIQGQVALLRQGRLDVVDADHIAEELEALARSEYAKLRSVLRVLLMHMLKWDQQPEMRTSSWVFSIREHRRRYNDILKDNPSLMGRREEARDSAYESARDWASLETHLPDDEFPDACPYDWDDILERPFQTDAKRDTKR